ncbi:MAG: hypothetical protein ICV83_25725, partial [Cytophagales bacterium]|nr:hypothetical protein [Cytophagales bacterium]
LYKALGQEVQVRSFFADPTVQGLAQHVEQVRRPAFASIPQTPPQDLYPVSHAQLRLWIIDQFEEERTAYHMSSAYLIEGLVPAAFRSAVALLIGRHEILRTTFVAVEGVPRQKIHLPDAWPLQVQHIDLTGEAHPEDAARRLAYRETVEAYDLEKGPLFRVRLLQVAAARYVVVLSMHHIISDGWSIELMIRELLAAYASILKGEPPLLSPLTMQYKDFAAWHNALLAGEQGVRLRQYWADKLSGVLPLLQLPTDYNRPQARTSTGAAVTTCFDEAMTGKLYGLSASCNASLFMTVAAGITTLLHRHTGQDDIILGTPHAGRSHPDLADQIGCYLNPVPMRMKLSRNQSFKEVLAHVNENCLDLYEYHLYPFDKLVEDLHVKRIPGRSPLFDVGLTWLSSSLSDTGHTDAHQLEISQFLPEAITAKNDLWFYCLEADGKLHISLVYDVRLFREATIEQLAADLLRIMEQVVQDAATALIDLVLGGEPAGSGLHQMPLSLQLNL